jgi:hypothetical protein
MNQKATYEITITEKLRQLQVPDMRDAIWSRIEQQLDLDMPEDDNHDDTPDSPKNGGWRKSGWKVGPFAVIVAIVTIFFINKSNNTKPKNTNQDQPANTQTVSPQSNDPTSPPTTRINPVTGKPEPVINNGNTPAPASDSVFNDQPLINNTIIDTTTKSPIINQPVVQQSAQPPPKQDFVPPKKPRGVKGINDKDYHITLKKDSVP